MVRMKAWSLPLFACSALVLCAAFPGGSAGAGLSTSWTIVYTDLKADLRAFSFDPLDPRRIYLGTDEKILASSDGGRTWSDLQGFRDDKIDLTSLPSEKAERYIALIEPSEETRARARRAADEGRRPEGAIPPPASGLPSGAAEAAAARIQNLQTLLNQADEEAKKDQIALALAEAEYGKWEPDDLTVSQVEGIEEGGDYSSDWIDEPYYSLLEDWLDERGLSVVASGPERKRTLIEYLQKHEVEGLELAATVTAAETALNSSESQYESLQAQIEAARTEQDLAAAAAADAARAQAAAESEAKSKGPARRPIEEATPVPPDEYISGITYIAVDPSRPERIIASTFDGIFLSLDRGKSWSLVYRGTGAGQSAIVCLAFDPSRPSIVFAGSLSGLVRSDDGGMTWARAEGIIADKVIISLAVHPSDSRAVFAGTEGDGLFKSLDGGKTWRQVFTHSTTEGNSVRSIAVSPARPDVVWLGTAGGVFLSRNGGRTWEKPLGQGLADTTIQHLVASPAAEGTAYAATPSGVFATPDGGRTFRRMTFGLNFRDGNFLAFEPGNAAALWLLTDQRVCRNGPRSRPYDPTRPLGVAPRTRSAALRPGR